jgi:hypothetical protein
VAPAKEYNALINKIEDDVLNLLAGYNDGNDCTASRLELMWSKIEKALDDLKMPEGGVP